MRVGTGAGQRQRFVGVLLVEELLDQRTGGDLPGLPLAEREVRAAPQAFVGVGLDRRTRRPGRAGASTSPATSSGGRCPRRPPGGLRRPGLAPSAGASRSCSSWSKPRPSSRSSWTSTSDRAGAGAGTPSPRPPALRNHRCPAGPDTAGVRDQDETGCHMTSTSAHEPAIRIHGLTKSYSSWRCCAAWTSRSRGAASSPCSARTGPQDHRGEDRPRCSRPMLARPP